LQTSTSWVLNPFTIDELGSGNYPWAQAALQPWCRGSGTWSDPYIIENVTINGGNSKDCLSIRNSDKYFIIRNCHFYNSNNQYKSGIELINTDNGKISNNNFESNYYGIELFESHNNTISGNTAINNIYGMSISDSNNNTILGNTCNENDNEGIYLIFSDNNTIMNNIITKNNRDGMCIETGNNNTVIGNTINNNNESGLSILDSADNKIL